jgi:hypothetical protein
MIRESSSVRLIWSLGCGPSTGGAGGRPPGFLPVSAAFSRAAYHTAVIMGTDVDQPRNLAKSEHDD